MLQTVCAFACLGQMRSFLQFLPDDCGVFTDKANRNSPMLDKKSEWV